MNILTKAILALLLTLRYLNQMLLIYKELKDLRLGRSFF